MERHNQGSQLLFRHVLELVDEQNQRGAFLSGCTPDGEHQFAQVVVQIAAIGTFGLGHLRSIYLFSINHPNFTITAALVYLSKLAAEVISIEISKACDPS